MAELNDIVREELDTKDWMDKPELVKRVLVRLNRLHRFAVNKVIMLGRQIRGVGEEPDIEVTVVWPEPEEEVIE